MLSSTATDFLDIPATSCRSDADCGGSERGRCSKNWPMDTNNEELARLLLPEFESGQYWPVCECKAIGGMMPKGPHCEDGTHGFLKRTEFSGKTQKNRLAFRIQKNDDGT